MIILSKRPDQEVYVICHSNSPTANSTGQIVDLEVAMISPVQPIGSIFKDPYWEDYDGDLTAQQVLMKYKNIKGS